MNELNFLTNSITLDKYLDEKNLMLKRIKEIKNNNFSSSRKALKEYRQLGYKIGNEKGFAIFRQSKNEPISFVLSIG